MEFCPEKLKQFFFLFLEVDVKQKNSTPSSWSYVKCKHKYIACFTTLYKHLAES